MNSIQQKDMDNRIRPIKKKMNVCELVRDLQFLFLMHFASRNAEKVMH